MSLGWLFTNLIAAFLLPPLLFLLIGMAGLLLLRRAPRLGRGLAWAGFLLVGVFSLPVVGNALQAGLEAGQILPPGAARSAQAIVVLGGGRSLGAPEFDGDTLGVASLMRVRYAARLHRETGLPLLVTGGRPDGGGPSEAALMKAALEREFGVPVRWVEDGSDNTRENAANSRALLAPAGVTAVLLVSQGWHLPRAREAFEAVGLRAIPAGTGFVERRPLRPLDFIPDASALGQSKLYFHEMIGRFWYWLRT